MDTNQLLNFRIREYYMHDIIYKSLINISWERCNCVLPNFSTCIFNTTSNSFSFLNSSNNDSEISFTHSAATSSPTNIIEMTRNDLPLRILVLNCQSIKSPGKPAQLSNIIEGMPSLNHHRQILL